MEKINSKMQLIWNGLQMGYYDRYVDEQILRQFIAKLADDFPKELETPQTQIAQKFIAAPMEALAERGRRIILLRTDGIGQNWKFQKLLYELNQILH